jgi:2-polyprenyl-6-methoxyphenol hydroxylase-like FAD-dependent oxidoreductase
MSIPPLQKHDLAGKRIIVAGAGLAGMAFARAMNQNWPSEHPKPEIIIYERSPKTLKPGREGYTMSIKKESGLQALDRIGLLDAALSSSTVGSNGIQQLPTIWANDWRPMLDFKDSPPTQDRIPTSGIRIVRHVLRQILVDGLPSDTKVHWKKGCDSVDIIEGGKVRVNLSNGSSDECDLLVAADGVNSNVRSALLPNDVLNYAGAICWQGTSKFPSGKPGLLQKKWGINISGSGVAFLNFPVDDATSPWALTYKSDQPRERIRGKQAVDRKQELLAEIQQRGKMFHEPFGEFIEATDPETLQVFSAEQKLPIVHSQKLPNANVVFIGDANSSKSPFSGSGANTALMDAVDLAAQLCKSVSIRAAIESFDGESVPRSRKAIKRGLWTIMLLHVDGIAFWLLRVFLAVVSFVLRFKG